MRILIFICFLFSHTFIYAQWALLQEIDSTQLGHIYSSSNDHFVLSPYDGPAKVFKTTDGGTTFEITQLQQYSINGDLKFYNNNIGYLGGGCYFTFEDCPANTLYKTVDGGTTWEMLRGNITSIGSIKSIAPASENTIFYLSNFDGFYRTVDGGENWTKLNLAMADEIHSMGEIQFLTPANGYLSAVTNYDTQTEGLSTLYKSTSSGTSWEIIFQEPASEFPINVFYFHYSNYGFIATDQGRLLVTTDTGESWQTITYGEPTESTTAFHFLADHTCYLASYDSESGESKIYRSTNGGFQWELDLTVTGAGIRDFYFHDAENGFAIVNYNQVYQRVNPSQTEEPPSIDFKISPNPSGNSIDINYDYHQFNSLWVQIRNIYGQPLLKRNIGIYTPRVDIQSLPSGTYIVQLIAPDGKILGTKKLIKS